MFEDMHYAGLGLYIGRWQANAGDEGNLRREIYDMTYGPEVQYACTAEPGRFVGTYATYVELAGQTHASR